MSIYTARMTDDWLPIPEAALKELGWQEGDSIQVDVCGDAVVLTKLADNTRATIRKKGAPCPARSIT